MRVFIVEDEAPAREELERLLEATGRPVVVAGRAESVAEAAAWLGDAANDADLLFLDIHLADGLSFEIFRRVEVDLPVIFTTAYDEYAIRAFRVTSVDYLLKPVEEEALAAALAKYDRLRARYGGRGLAPEQVEELLHSRNGEAAPSPYPKRLVVPAGEKFKRVEIEDTAYFFADDKFVFAVGKDGRRQLVDHTLEELTALLDPREFFRLNRRYLAREDSIADVERFFNRRIRVRLQPDPGDRVLVSRLKARDFLKWLEG